MILTDVVSYCRLPEPRLPPGYFRYDLAVRSIGPTWLWPLPDFLLKINFLTFWRHVAERKNRYERTVEVINDGGGCENKRSKQIDGGQFTGLPAEVRRWMCYETCLFASRTSTKYVYLNSERNVMTVKLGCCTLNVRRRIFRSQCYPKKNKVKSRKNKTKA